MLENFIELKKKHIVKKLKDNLKWGEPRATQDIDIVVLMGKDRVFGFLKEAKKYGFSYQKEEINNFSKANLLRLV